MEIGYRWKHMTTKIQGRSEMSIKNRYNSFIAKIYNLEVNQQSKTQIYLNQSIDQKCLFQIYFPSKEQKHRIERIRTIIYFLYKTHHFEYSDMSKAYLYQSKFNVQVKIQPQFLQLLYQNGLTPQNLDYYIVYFNFKWSEFEFGQNQGNFNQTYCNYQQQIQSIDQLIDYEYFMMTASSKNGLYCQLVQEVFESMVKKLK